MLTDWLAIVVTLALGVAGFYLGHSYRRQSRIAMADARRSAYSELWELTGLAAPTRLDQAGSKGALTLPERERLYQSLTSWYYRNGNGMLLEATTRTVYLSAKHNLICRDEDLRPAGLLELFPEALSRETKRGCISIRQLSLLRTQMKSDLAVFGRPYVSELARHERDFLTYCNVSLWHTPWRSAARRTRPETCTAHPAPAE